MPLALVFSEQRFPVTGFDIDREKVATLNAGGSSIYRVAPEEIGSAQKHGFNATEDYSAIQHIDAVVICVPTPLNEYREPDLSFIVATAESIATHLRAGQLIVLESTTYPGTTEEVVVAIVERENAAGLKFGRDGVEPGEQFYVAFSPERVDPGNDQVARHDIPPGPRRNGELPRSVLPAGSQTANTICRWRGPRSIILAHMTAWSL